MHKKYLTFDKELTFDDIFNHLEKFVDINGKTGIYLQYAQVRAKKILASIIQHKK